MGSIWCYRVPAFLIRCRNPEAFHQDGDGVILQLTKGNLEETDYARQHLFAKGFGQRMQTEEYAENVFAVTSRPESFGL